MDDMNKYGAWAFLVGLILAILAGFIDIGTWVSLVLLLLGVIVGLLNIKDKEMMLFLVAGIALTAGLGSLGALAATLGFGLNVLVPIFNNIALFVGPAIGIVALKAIYGISKD
ncbi:MAG: hypothetical protein ABH803_00230 [Candidatus Micrarchaeota archaeon]